jgi:aspartate kinase
VAVIIQLPFIGAVLKVREIQIWTDISGFHNNDPRFVEKTEVT